MKKLLPALTVALFTTLLSAQTTDPMITSWWFNTTNQTYNGNLVNVEAVYYSSTRVYIKATGIASYYTDGTAHFDAVAKNNTFILPRTQTVPSSDNDRVYLRDEGSHSVFIDGTVGFSPGDNKTYNNGDVWHQIAYKFEGMDFDAYNGHSSPSGAYHHHVDPSPLYSTNSSVHSGIVGFAFDGYPIYGPYAYTNVDGTGAIKRMTSSWAAYTYPNGTRNVFPDGSTPSQTGPTTSVYPSGNYFEDYVYTAGSGDLDRYNGRFCVTPEYPNGTYCYFITLGSDLKPAFPYIIGDYMYATPIKSNGKMVNTGVQLTNNSVPSTGVTQYSPSTLPVELLKFEVKAPNCTAELHWLSAMEDNFDRYEIEWSEEEGKKFEKIGSITAKGSNNSYFFAHKPMDGISYYRLKMVNKDGSFKYSSIRSALLDCGFKNVAIDVYPNPFFGSIAVEMKTADTEHTINVYNMAGKMVLSTKGKGFIKLDMANQPSGSYVVEVLDAKKGNGYMKKMIKP